jgi:hypothetical protein
MGQITAIALLKIRLRIAIALLKIRLRIAIASKNRINNCDRPLKPSLKTAIAL